MRTSLQLACVLVLATNVTAKALDLSQVIFDFRGDPVLDESRPGPRDPQTGKLTPPRFCFADEFVINPKNCDALRLGTAIAVALTRGNDPENPDPSFDELKRRDLLASKAANMDNVEITPEERVLIRRMIKKYFLPVVSARVLQVLEK